MRGGLLSACLAGFANLAFAAPSVFERRQSQRPTVDLGYEVHRGTVNSTGNYYIFSNIPYAQQPVDGLRFQKPVAITGRSLGVNDGSNDVMCVQAYPQWIVELFAEGSEMEVEAQRDALNNADGQTESCLMLDVYVPADVFNAGSAAEAPVLVWIHGGGFTYGSKSSDGQPAGLIARSQSGGQSGMIVVSINYRLGMYGWLGGDDVTRNLGLYDQRLALEWVQQYISRFGGSPGKVTAMGESAGASSIVHHITAYGGLLPAPFRAAIPQSPAFQFNIDLAAGYESTLTEAASQTGTDVGDVAGLSKLDADVLKSVNQAVVYPAPMGTFAYGVGPDGSYVPNIPQVLLLEGRFDQSVNLMISHTSNESVPFTPNDIATAADLRAHVESNFPEASNATVDTLLADVYPDVLDGTYPWTTQFGRAAAIGSEAQFSCITGYLAAALGNATHNYVFAYPPGYHAGDLPYVFFNGDTSTPNNGLPVDPGAAAALQDYIVAFARTGDPNVEGRLAFPGYGGEGRVLRLGYEGFAEGADDVRNDRCAWIQQAMADGRL